MITLIALHALGCAHTGRVPTTEHAAASYDTGYLIPTSNYGPFIFIDVKINGKGPFRMLLDTGCSFTLISPDRVLRIVDSTNPVKKALTDSHGRDVPITQSASIDSMQMGEFDVPLDSRSRIAYVRNIQSLRAYLGENLDGVIGWPTFRRVLLRIDFSRRMVTVESGSLSRIDGRGILRLDTKASALPSVDADVGGESRAFDIDTGSNNAWDLAGFEHLKLAGEAVSTNSLALSGLDQDRAGRLAGDIRLGPVLYRQPVIDSPSDGANRIGLGALQPLILTFDFWNSRIQIENLEASEILTPPYRTIEAEWVSMKSLLWVTKVKPRSGAARSGLAIGDHITAIDGHRIDEGALFYPLGAEATLTIRRGDSELQLRVPTAETVP